MEAVILVVAILGVGAITPGPNNFMVMAAGARGGLQAARPVIGGVVAGGLVLLFLVWSGVAAALTAVPALRLALALAGAAYLSWLGGSMMCRTRPELRAVARGDHWLGVAAFQLFNPKAWALLVTAATAMSREFDGAQGLLVLAAIYCARSAFSLSVWAVAGSALTRWFDGSGRGFERVLGGLLILLGLSLVAGERVIR